MKGLFVFILILFSGLSKAQQEIAFSDTQRKEIDHASGSAFMQYSNFQPRSFNEVFMSISGNEKMDSILLASDIDTLHKQASRIFSTYVRKYYGLETIHSPTTSLFYRNGMYSSEVIQSFIILAYTQYLRKEPIRIAKVRRKVTKGHLVENRKAKNRLKKELREYRKRD